MAEVEAKIAKMGLYLPEPFKAPPGMVLPFKTVIVRGNHAYIAGHAPQAPDGSPAQPLGKVGSDLTLEQGAHAAMLVGLSMLASLKREIGDLDRVTQWLRVLGMVNVAPGFNSTTPVINGFSNLIVELYGPERGAHTRSAVGMAVLPLDLPVEIEGEVEIAV
ncbi:enamine deaminase RidA (YjgF/YER057c/UK114 family) [Rhodoligotrophos appendicifer]|uniref:RidA family protein n=1 Tax=Rhodoligotrophos appendicifer TaxID=987056 RepID=UPI001184FEF0|nr:RidA family protein [Rhodoligotrophos appendicifer]